MPVVMVSDLCLYFFDKKLVKLSQMVQKIKYKTERPEQNHAAAFGTH
jgi:hypothetical protein